MSNINSFPIPTTPFNASTLGVLEVANNLSDVADASTSRTNLGLAIGTDVQAYSADLAAIAGLTSAADRLPYYTGSQTAALATFTGFARTLLDDADAATARTTLGVTIGTDVQAFDAGLQSIAGLSTSANQGIYTTGSDTYATFALTAAGRALLDDADAAAQRTTLGLGTIATQDANNVAITGGSVTGITDIAVADGGTGASNASAARTNLGVAIGSDVQAFDAGLQSIAGLTTSANQGIYATGADTYATFSLTAAGRALLDDADAAAQRTTLGGTTAGQSFFTLSNPSAVTFPRINADNTVTARTAAEFRADIGAPDDALAREVRRNTEDRLAEVSVLFSVVRSEPEQRDAAGLNSAAIGWAERARGGASLAFKAGAGFYSIAGQVLRPNPDLLGLSVARASKAWNPNWTGVHGARVGRLVEYGPDEVRSGDHGVVKETAAATNYFTNPLFEGGTEGVVTGGSPTGVLPTGMQMVANGATIEYLGRTVTNGRTEALFKFSATPTGDPVLWCQLATSALGSATGNSRTGQITARLVSGALTNTNGARVRVQELTSAGASVTSGVSDAVMLDADQRGLFLARTMSGGGTVARSRHGVELDWTSGALSGAPVIAISCAQFEAGLVPTSPVFPIPNTPATSTRAAETFTYGAIQTIRPSRETYRNADGSLSTFLNDTVAYGAAGIAAFEASTNRQPNPHFVGASGSTPPTGWIVIASGAAITYTRTTHQGRSALRIAVSGSVTAGIQWLMQGTTTNVAANGQTWTMTMDAMLEAGALPGNFALAIQERTDAGALIATGNATRTLTRQMRRLEPYTRTLSGGGTVGRANDRLLVNSPAGDVSFTLLLVGPQFEQKPASTPLILPPLNTVAVSDRAASYQRIPVSALPSLVGGVTIRGEVEVEGVSSASGRQAFGSLYRDGSLRHYPYLDANGVWRLFGWDGELLFPQDIGYTIAAGRTRHRIAVRWTDANVGWAVSDGVNTYSKLDIVPDRSLQLANITHIYPASENTIRQLNGLVTDFRVTPGGLTDAELLEWVRF